jgi:hypothetical protein
MVRDLNRLAENEYWDRILMMRALKNCSVTKSRDSGDCVLIFFKKSNDERGRGVFQIAHGPNEELRTSSARTRTGLCSNQESTAIVSNQSVP